MNRTLALLLLVLAAPAMAQEPTEEQKINALKWAYHMNGDSMVRAPELGSIDLIAPRIIQTVPEMPVADPANKNKLDALADVNLTPPPRSVNDICAVHGLRKVEERGGKTWKCRK